MSAPPLSLADLEEFDPQAPDRGGRERRFCCKLCGADKPKDAAHRSLSVNLGTGAWSCHRCGSGGKLRDFWEERPPQTRRERARSALNRAFAPVTETVPPVPADPQWRQHLKGLVKLTGTHGAAYLQRRGVSLDTAIAAGVRYSPSWYGTQSVVFPVRDQEKNLVAAVGRRVDDGKPKSFSAGDVRHGVFATAGAWKADPLILTEGPVDALVLATVGYPAIALCGASNLPHWLPQTCAFRRVLIATDRDEAGDKAAEKIAAALRPLGAKVERLRPGVWWKDWADFSAASRDALRAALATEISGANQDSSTPVLWDNKEADALLSASYRRIGETVPGGAVPWADAFRPALMAAVDAATQQWEAAYNGQDLAGLESALAAFEAALAAVTAAFLARETAPTLAL